MNWYKRNLNLTWYLIDKAIISFNGTLSTILDPDKHFICDICEKYYTYSSFCGFILLPEQYQTGEVTKLLYPLKSRAPSKAIYQICISCGKQLDCGFNDETEAILESVPAIWGQHVGWVNEHGDIVSMKNRPESKFNSTQIINLMRLRALVEKHHDSKMIFKT